MINISDLIKIEDWLWEIPKSHRHDMRVPARIYATENMLREISGDRSLEQLVNVTTLPGIVNYALVMPDAHEGYGFPIGGVAGFDLEEGIVSPGGIGYDINCGVKLLYSSIDGETIKPYVAALGSALYRKIPSGVGRSGMLDLNDQDLDLVLKGGARRMVELGYGEEGDLLNSEANGCLLGAEPSLVSDHAKDRGRDQLGTMGAGNHFVEVQVVEEIFDEAEAAKRNLFKGQAVVMIHSGSRGLGHQIATDYIKKMMVAMPKYGIYIPDRELSCAPIRSSEGRDYLAAMSSGANFAWANRELIAWEVRQAWREVLGEAGGELKALYDVAHNIAKIEEYEVEGKPKKLVIHRKGATRSFPGQPVLIPGSMGTRSYLLVGQEGAMKNAFGSSCHGAGRKMSRTAARREIQGRELKERLADEGIIVNVGSIPGLAEEAPGAYKDVERVVNVVDRADIAKKVARFRPIAVVKG